MPTDPSARYVRDAQGVRARNMRLGLSLFALYSALYASFVFASAFFPDVMEIRPWGGLNLALLSGFGLIGVAILLAFIYGVFSHTAAEEAKR